MDLGIAGRTAIVCASSRGLGRGCAVELARAGCRVVINGRDEARLEQTADEIRALTGSEVVPVAADVATAEGQTALLAAAPTPDILVTNNAGPPFADFRAITRERAIAGVVGNMIVPIELVQRVIDGMVERRFGRIVAIASTAGLKGYPYVSAYCAAKHAVVGLVRALAVEVAQTGVTVNAVCPGFTDTDLVAESLERIVQKTGRSREAALAELVRHNPQKRLIDPREVADAVLWLCGEGAGSVTGQAIAVAGGEV
jgi:3-hydroxybutyrate dehydrogenase